MDRTVLSFELGKTGASRTGQRTGQSDGFEIVWVGQTVETGGRARVGSDGPTQGVGLSDPLSTGALAMPAKNWAAVARLGTGIRSVRVSPLRTAPGTASGLGEAAGTARGRPAASENRTVRSATRSLWRSSGGGVRRQSSGSTGRRVQGRPYIGGARVRGTGRRRRTGLAACPGRTRVRAGLRARRFEPESSSVGERGGLSGGAQRSAAQRGGERGDPVRRGDRLRLHGSAVRLGMRRGWDAAGLRRGRACRPAGGRGREIFSFLF